MKSIAVLNYGSGNIFSLNNALKYIGVEIEVISCPTDMNRFDKFVLPGVGAFGSCMKMLDETGFADEIVKQSATGKTFLGICVGMQVFFERSHEFGCHKGLGFFSGEIGRLPLVDDLNNSILAPHIGWAPLCLKPSPKISSPMLSLLSSLDEDAEYYFIHSFVARPKDPGICMAECSYSGIPFTAIAGANNILGVQFHPEKSGEAGLDFLRRWATAEF